MKTIGMFLCLALCGCSGINVELEQKQEVIWMDPLYERGQIPSEWQLGIRADGVVVSRTNTIPIEEK